MDRKIRRFKRATNVQAFGRDHAADFAAGSKATELFAELDAIIVKLTIARVGQLRSPVGKATLIDALCIEFKAIDRTARAIELDEPDFDDAPYRHPATSSETSVITHADSLLKLLEDDHRPVADGGDTPARLTVKAALRAKFIAYELPSVFVEDLRAVRDALDLCDSDKSKDFESASAIDTLLGKAQAIITRLDAAIQNKYSRDPDKLAAWKSASRTKQTAKKAAPVSHSLVA